MKLKVQAQSLWPGDIVGSGEVVAVVQRSISIPSDKVLITLHKADKGRSVYWGKYTTINVERSEPTHNNRFDPVLEK